ncbi:urease accessory protein UreD [Novosphingobium endophyticum]|uniref:urease accessory protein UreD n=1 Tax=Novosphingobium endophyticum TaxID=1955250 RepID=UPI001E60E83F|nr:urease accessory protein UreD [Novosphingobium endophyticum]
MTLLGTLPLREVTEQAHEAAEKSLLPPRHQRVDGAARVAFGPAGLSDLYQKAPCRLLFPDIETGDFPQAVSITTSGGLTGGDRVVLDISIEPGACATVSTQAAEKLYRVLPDDPAIHIETRINIAEGGRCEWLAQEAILFDRSQVRRHLHAHLAADARLLAVETIVFGRAAMGEVYAEGLIHDEWRIWRSDELIWADALHIDGKFAEIAAQPFCLGPARALATMVYAGADAADHLPLAREMSDGCATCFGELLLVRLIDADSRLLRSRVMRAASALRAATLGLPDRLPAVWYC